MAALVAGIHPGENITLLRCLQNLRISTLARRLRYRKLCMSIDLMRRLRDPVNSEQEAV
jgi:hypothetical protein